MIFVFFNPFTENAEMTEKLYYQDAHLFQFTAAVLSCSPEKDGFAVELDRTAFYPEGGGQPSDEGFLIPAGGQPVRVSFVKERDGVIIHSCDSPLTPGQTVSGQVDAERRLDLMQQHSGEHIASGLICRHFGCDNVGFHISDPFVTIDYNVPISWEALLEIEDEANRVVRDNRPVHIFWPSAEELKALEYRSKKELTGDVRIVEYPDADVCACCGTHVSFTGEVGLIKFISVQSHRGGVRIEMLSGKRALSYMRQIQAENHAVSVALSARETQTAAAVLRLQKEALALHERLATLEEESTHAKAARLSGKGNVLLVEKGLSVDSARRLAAAVMETCGGFCGVLSDCGEDGIRYVLGQEGGDLRELTKALNSTFSGRGGGKPFFVQGTLHGNVQEAAAFLQKNTGAQPV